MGKPDGRFGFWNKKSRVGKVTGTVLLPIHLAAEGVWFAWRSSGFVFAVLAVALEPHGSTAGAFLSHSSVSSDGLSSAAQLQLELSFQLELKQSGNPLLVSVCQGSGSHGFWSGTESVVTVLLLGGSTSS